ncbi:uncharacterized protein LOC132172667 [Corylus avellana]|uniref:uncharacterized protein LOC132172667 n=1 Tax=Corylus avellana TaxID=13451 RepID=UPI00286A7C6B|nr:uncharacterized protein LOC132172667 [Corylus avellana]
MANSPDDSAAKKDSKLTTFLKNLIIPTYLPCLQHEELPNEIRNVLLVAVALIAAVTFQAGVAPPGGVWQDDKAGPGGIYAGQAIYSSQPVAFHFFLICNTLAFSSSIFLLLSLTFGYPFFLEVLVATFSMSGTYAAAIFSVTPYETGKFRLIALVAALPIVIRAVIFSSSWMIKKRLL